MLNNKNNIAKAKKEIRSTFSNTFSWFNSFFSLLNEQIFSFALAFFEEIVGLFVKILDRSIKKINVDCDKAPRRNKIQIIIQISMKFGTSEAGRLDLAVLKIPITTSTRVTREAILPRRPPLEAGMP